MVREQQLGLGAVIGDGSPSARAPQYTNEERVVKAEDVRELDDAELVHRLGKLKQERFRLLFQSECHDGTRESHAGPLGELRKDIARIKTVLRRTRKHAEADSTDEA